MSDSHAVYHSVDSLLSSRDRCDRALHLCFDGYLTKAWRFVSDEDDADTLLARGVLTYWQARTGTQYTYEAAKDILSKSARLFCEVGDLNRSALAEIWIGLCYWRQGQPAEAFLLLTRASASADADSRVRFLAAINRSVLQTEYKAWQVSLETLQMAQPYFDSEPSLSWRGKFFQQRGLSYKLAFDQTGNKDYLDKALMDYEAASEHYEQVGNVNFEAAILNNIANLYRGAGDLVRAAANADRAITLYERVGDRSHLAHAKDTKAQILLAQGQLAKAKRYADQAISLLELHDPCWVTTPLVTKAKVMYRMEQFSSAQRVFEQAIKVAEGSGDKERIVEIQTDYLATMGDVLSPEKILEIFLRIEALSPSALSGAACKALNRLTTANPHSLKDLKSIELNSERCIIRDALQNSGGSVTHAAEVLGKTHGGLAHIIRTRHPELTQYCNPIVKRCKRIKRH